MKVWVKLVNHYFYKLVDFVCGHVPGERSSPRWTHSYIVVDVEI